MTDSPAAAAELPHGSPSPRSRVLPWLWRLLVAAIMAVLLWRIVLPQLHAAWHDVHRLPDYSFLLAGLGFLVELGSIAAYGLLTYAVLPPATRPRPWRAIRINLAGVAATNALPSGGALGTALRLSLLGGGRSAYAGAAGGLAMELPISGVVLSAIFVTGAIGCLPAAPGGRWQGVAVVIVVGMLVLFALLAVALTNRRAMLRVLAALLGWLPTGVRRRTVVFANETVRNMAVFARTPRRLATPLGWAAANWLLDATALGTFLAAAGFRPGILALLLAHGLACVLALLPFTPAGLGVVEGVLVPTLVALGASPAEAVLGVTGWRLAQYWLPIPLGALALLTLRWRPRRRPARTSAA
ncbi:MAG TPA: YbhN family protein [Gryllotalpicola sp.]